MDNAVCPHPLGMHRIALWALFFMPILAPPVTADEVPRQSDYEISYISEWEWYSNELIPPGTFDRRTPEAIRDLPYTYSARSGPTQFTLRRILHLPASTQPYALKITYLASSYRVFLNGDEVLSTGSVEPPYRPRYQPTEVFFTSDGDPTEIVIHGANDHHRRVRLAPIQLGRGRRIEAETTRRVIRDSILFGSLLLLSLYHILLFTLYQKERSVLFFAIIAGISALRVGVTTERILVRIWPEMPGELMMKIGFAPVFLLLPLFILYIAELGLFSYVGSLRKPAKWFGIASSLLIIATPVSVYDAIFQFGLPVIVFGAIYVLIQVLRADTKPKGRSTDGSDNTDNEILHKTDTPGDTGGGIGGGTGGARESREASLVLFFGASVVTVAAILDYLREIDRIQTPELLSLGILVFLLLQAYFLAHRLQQSAQRSDLLAATVRALNTDLEHRISVRTKELAEANQQLQILSRTDVLTGLANRRFFNDTFERGWKHALREQRSIAVVLLDVDRFKLYNDQYGHIEGDRCLQAIAGVIGGATRRDTDLAARYGGEEFVVLMPGADVRAAHEIAEKIRAGIERLAIAHSSSPEGDIVTASLGYAAIVPTREDSPQSLLTVADGHLYTAKRNGRNRIYPPGS